MALKLAKTEKSLEKSEEELVNLQKKYTLSQLELKRFQKQLTEQKPKFDQLLNQNKEFLATNNDLITQC